MNSQKTDVIIIDYGIGNLASVRNMLAFVGANGVISSDPQVISTASKLILPGIGNFAVGMSAFLNRGLNDPLNDAIKNGSKLLGICLGFQLLFESSEECPGQSGLGLIKGSVRKFAVERKGLRIPHIGWNVVIPKTKAQLFDHLQDELRYYFAHTYYAECDEENAVAATCDYGGEFVCSIEKNNIFGVQFHPEKSHRFGADTFTRFVNL